MGPLRTGEGAISELASPNPFDPNQGRSPIHRARWLHSPREIMSTFVMKATDTKSSSTGAMIRTN